MATPPVKPRNTGLKIISVVLAILLWLYVMNQGQLSTRQSVLEVDLDYIHLAEGLTVEGPDKVSLRLWGVFQEPGNVKAYVDMSGLGQGTHNVPVHVEPVSGSLFTRVEPDRIDVVVRKTKQHIVDIVHQVVQNPPAGYELLDVLISPDECLVKGDDEAVSLVSTVVCQINLAQATGMATFDSPLIARDANGNQVTQGIRLVPDHVQVVAVIREKMETKTVPLQPNLTGQLAEGLQLGTVTLEPETITIVGNPVQLQTITQIQTDPINLQDHRESFTEMVPITLPKGLRGYPEEVKVFVEIIEPTPQDED